MLASIVDNEIYKLTIFSSSISDKFTKIFQTPIIRAQFTDTDKKFKKMIKEFIENLFIITMQSIKGLTLCNRKILIKGFSNNAIDYNKNKAYWGFTLMTAIHELGHFSQRFHLAKDKEWFEYSSSKKIKIGSDPNNPAYSRESGSDLIEAIFGYEPITINEKASELLLDINSWRLPQTELQDKFTELNKFDPLTDAQLIKERKVIMLKKEHTKDITVLKLGGCRFAFGRIAELRRLNKC